MQVMKVKDLLEILQTLDPELPIHRCRNGEYPPVDIEYAGYSFRYEQIMQGKNDQSYFARANDPMWQNKLDSFTSAFKAVIIE